MTDNSLESQHTNAVRWKALLPQCSQQYSYVFGAGQFKFVAQRNMKIAFCVAEILQEKNSGNLPVLLHPFILFFFFFFDKALIRERGKITHGIKNMIEYVIIKGK